MMRERFRAARKRLVKDFRKAAGGALRGAAISITVRWFFFPLTIGYLVYRSRKSKHYQEYEAGFFEMDPGPPHLAQSNLP
jgi:hypothetical protein